MNAEKLVSTKRMAEILGCTPDTVHNLRDAGKIKGYKFVRDWRWDPTEVLKALGRKKT